MYKFMISLMISLMTLNFASAQFKPFSQGYEKSSEHTTMTFSNSSNYVLTIKILSYYDGLHAIVSLGAHESRVLSFNSSDSFKMKIKASHNGQVSYHDAGSFSVTCNSREYSQGKITFSMSTYGSGLGPSISATEFEKDY